MKHRRSVLSYVVLTVVLNCVSCVSMLNSVILPITVRVLDIDTGRPVEGATVQLQWSSGFQGYYWGKPVAKQTDAQGSIVFASPDVPPISSDGYSLGEKITKVFITAIVVSAPGYNKTAFKEVEPTKPIELRIPKLKPSQDMSSGANL